MRWKIYSARRASSMPQRWRPGCVRTAILITTITIIDRGTKRKLRVFALLALDPLEHQGLVVLEVGAEQENFRHALDTSINRGMGGVLAAEENADRFS